MTATRNKPAAIDDPVWLALPAGAAIALCGLLTLLILTARPDRSRLIDRYERAADAAIAVGDARVAQVCAVRLVQLDRANTAHAERLAIANAMNRR